MENLNSVNAGQAEVVAPDMAGGTISAVAGNQQSAEGVANSQGNQPQTREENSKFAEMRRGKENAEKELNSLKNSNKVLMDALKQLGYDGTENDILDKLSAESQGITIEQYRANEQAHYDRVSHDPRVVEAQRVLQERQFETDLKAIKEVYPEVTAESVLELGDTYLSIMRTGGASPIDAYAAQKAADERARAKIPPVIGEVNMSSPEEKDFYTSEEVDKLSDKELSNPKIMNIVLKSMTKWNK